MDEIEAEEAVVGRDFNLKPPRDARWQSWRKTATSVVGWGAAGLGLAYGLMHFPVHVKLFAAVAAQPSWSWHFLAAHAAGFGGLGLHRGLCNGTAYLALDSGWLDQALGAVKGLDGVRVSSIREWAHFRVVWQPQLAYWYDDLLSQPQMLHNMPSFPHIIRRCERRRERAGRSASPSWGGGARSSGRLDPPPAARLPPAAPAALTQPLLLTAWSACTPTTCARA